MADKFDMFVIVYLDEILIFIENPGQPHVKAIHWILDQLQKYFLFTSLKKCCFYQDEFHFLGYIVSFKEINMKAQQIKVVKKWPKPKSI